MIAGGKRMKNLMIGIDIGTSGVKVAAVDEKGRVAGKAFAEYALKVPRAGWAEQDAGDWWRGVTVAMKGLWGSGVRAGDVAAVSFSGQMHGLVTLDEHGELVRDAIIWCDQRTAGESEWIEARYGPDLIRATGNPPLAGFTLPKLVWMRRHEPALFGRIGKVLLPKDYVRYRMCGGLAVDVSDAAGTCMMDIDSCEWIDWLLDELGIKSEWMPEVVASDHVCGAVTREAAVATGLVEGTPVIAGGADNTCAAVGTGVVRDGRVSSSIGSSGVVFAHSDTLRVDPGGRVHSFNHSVRGSYYLMGVALSAGMSMRWLRDTVFAAEAAGCAADGRDIYDMMTGLAREVPPGSDGVVFLPYLSGERTPHRDPYARGVFFGLALSHGRGHIVRAVMEGVVLALADGLDIVRELGGEVTEVRATGGGAKSELWRQMQADVFGVPVVTLESDEGPSYGAALIAGAGAGIFESIAAAADANVKIAQRVMPDMERHEIYMERQGLYRELYVRLKESFRNAR